MQTTPSSPGLYDSFLTPEEIRDHRAIPRGDLTSEINLLRVITARYLGWLQTPGGEIVVNDALMRSLARIMGQIARLVSAHMQLNPPLASLAEDIEEGLNLTRLQAGILDPGEFHALIFPLHAGLPPPS